MPRNLKLTIAYDGTDYCGWQIQPERPTIQGILGEVLNRVTGEQAFPQGSGRTDAGVHAIGQVANFTTAAPIPAPNLIVALNDLLPRDIRVLSAEEVAADFHSRRSAKAKTYRYRILREDICSPFVARFVCHHPYPLNEEAMVEAASNVVGEHDFTSFAAVDPDRQERIRELADEDGPNNIRRIFESWFIRKDGELIYTVRGSGFLQYMVRNLVGTFLLVGKGTINPNHIPQILAARARSQNPGATSPPSGLCLMRVEY